MSIEAYYQADCETRREYATRQHSRNKYSRPTKNIHGAKCSIKGCIPISGSRLQMAPICTGFLYPAKSILKLLSCVYTSSTVPICTGFPYLAKSTFSAICHLGHREENTTYDWISDVATYGGYNVVAHGPKWIRQAHGQDLLINNLPPVLPETFNIQQQLVFNKIFNAYRGREDNRQLLMIVAGTAGSSKSYLINVIRYIIL